MLSLFVYGLVGIVYCGATTTMPPQTGGGAQDHLLQVLEAMHKLNSFHQLPPSERVVLVELIAAAEADQITHYIDRIGFTRILIFIDHVTKIDSHEAHRLEEYLWKELDQERPSPVGPLVIGKKRDVQSILNIAQNMMSYTNLTSEERQLIQEIIQGAENGALTPVVHREGYSKIIKLIEGDNLCLPLIYMYHSFALI
ncbi:hypothetical protein FSP39_009520 [Pinctada imbricata]|uniref:Uncharacterized protein n=1 Tax=Pinctada imbricata TaxID=66713 RepID=A0AA89C5T4_PINIB|nr:hypothetical protein FSP39_009520 [Pinctada imbricata]